MEVGDAVAVGGEAAGCEGGERIVHGIEEIHPAEIVSQGTSHGDQQVGAPQPVGGGGDTRVKLPNFSPVDSAEKSCCSPTPRAGSRARVKR